MVAIARNLIPAVFVSRENRFVGTIKIENEYYPCHILNPGRMVEFLKPNCSILVESNSNPHRKLKYSLKYVVTPSSLILIDSIISNKIFLQALQERKIPEFEHVTLIKPEQPYGNGLHSRIDFVLDNNIFIEIKSTNYMVDHIGYFPDAPSQRAQKHVQELINLVINQPHLKSYIIFIAQRTDIKEIRPFDRIDPKFSSLLREGFKKGVKISAFSIKFYDGGMFAELGASIPVHL